MNIRSLLLLFTAASAAMSQAVEFPSQWKFTTGDQARYKEPSYDDSQWPSVAVPGQWETQGFPDYDGFAWYRLHFSVPRSFVGKELYLLLGKVDDVDETFLNGTRIGSSGKFPPKDVSAWNLQRVYLIPAGMLKEKNLFAVRVYDGGAPGGIIGGSLGIFTKKGYEEEMNLGPAPKHSYYSLTTSNGLVAAVFDTKKNAVMMALPHIFQAYDSGRSVEAFARGIRLTGSAKPTSVSYERHTHVIKAAYPNYSVYYFAPFTIPEKVLCLAVRGRASAVRNIELDSAFIGTRTVQSCIIRPTAGDTAEKYFLISFNADRHDGAAAITRTAVKIVGSQTSFIQDEIDFMSRIISSCRLPAGLTPAERSVAEQSIAVLKMAQVGDAENIPGARGQILASLPPGMWNISWVRDASYAIEAMSRLGMFDEARRALRFMFTARSGQYQKYTYTDGKDHGIGVDYQISVCRYFGNGREESDFNENGPNIEIDGFGLTLSAVAEYIHHSGDTTFFREWNGLIASKIADPLIHCIDSTGLIRAESGPWERHLPGKHYAFTSVACAAGLRRFAALQEAAGYPSAAYAEAADQLTDAILSRLVYRNEFIKGNLEGVSPSDHEFIDGGTMEAFAAGVVTEKGLFRSHMAAYDKELRVNDPKRGYIRINSPDWYESQEWLFLDARIASAQVRFGNLREAKRLLDWITSQSVLNYGLIPEMYGRENANYEGAVPMVGFGAGAYILALFDYHNP